VTGALKPLSVIQSHPECDDYSVRLHRRMAHTTTYSPSQRIVKVNYTGA
jgi:hypothetical protein